MNQCVFYVKTNTIVQKPT